MRRFERLGAAAVPALLLASCAGGGGSRVAPPPAVAGITPAMATAAYVAAAASIDLFEIQSAELALQRARDPANRAFAQRTMSAHQGTSAQLSMAGRRLDLLPSATLSPDHRAMLDALRAAPDFDRVYREQQAALHRQGVSLHGGYARGGSSPTLRPVARNAEDVMRRNQEALRR
jgi:putative membrane protein